MAKGRDTIQYHLIVAGKRSGDADVPSGTREKSDAKQNTTKKPNKNQKNNIQTNTDGNPFTVERSFALFKRSALSRTKKR
jgi:hypothetical protein